MAAKKTSAAAEPAPLDVGALEGATEYDSIRCKSPTHVRGGYGNNLAGSGRQRLFFRALPFPHVVVMPDGTEIPMENIASLVPKGRRVTR